MNLGILAQLLDNKEEPTQTPEGGVIAPIQGAQVAPQASQYEGYSPEQRAKLREVLYNDTVNPDNPTSGGKGQSGLVSTRPDWFQGGEPPKANMGLGIANTATQAMAAGAQKRADLGAANPLRSLAAQQGDQRAATRASVLAGLTGLLANGKQSQFENEQNAALKQAQMYRVLNPGSDGHRASASAAALNYDQRNRQISDMETKAAAAQQLEKNRNDPASPESQAAQKVAMANYWVTPDEAGQYSYNDIEKNKSGWMQKTHENWRGKEGDRMRQNQEADRIEAQNREQIVKAEAEKRAEEQRQEEYQVPGVAWEGGHPPNPQAYEKVAQAKQAHDVIQTNTERLKEIQHQLNDYGVLAAAGGKYALVQGAIGAMDPEKGKQVQGLLQEAKQLQRGNVNAYRQRAQYGALTGNEQALSNEMEQAAGSPEGFFIGDAAWDAALKDNQTQTRQVLKAHKGYFEGEEPKRTSKLDRPVEERIHKFEAPAKIPYSRGGASAAPEPAAVGETATPSRRWVTVTTKHGESSAMPVDDKNYQKLVQQYGADKVHDAQGQ